LKTKLEQADDENDTFLDLPPELRVRIYTQYFTSYDDDNPKGQPPISYTSRTVRQEVLPLFYECSQFFLSAWAEYQKAFTPITNDQSIIDVLSPLSRKFMVNTSAANLARIRSLNLKFLDCEMRLRLDTNDQKDPIQITPPYIVDLATGNHSTPALRECKECMLSDLRSIAKEIAEREGPLKLRETDLARLYETVRIAFVAYYP
jgi:hypothetical protein